MSKETRSSKYENPQYVPKIITLYYKNYTIKNNIFVHNSKCI